MGPSLVGALPLGFLPASSAMRRRAFQTWDFGSCFAAMLFAVAGNLAL
jgi:hypothetical protein